MKKILFLATTILLSLSASAQVMTIKRGGKVVAQYKGADYEVVFEEDNSGNDDPDITVGSTAKPTDWKIPAAAKLYPAAMYVTIDSDGVPVPLEDGDLLAAFIDGTCHGVAVAETGTDKYTRITLKVNLFQGEESRNDLKVELRFYSNKYKRIFRATPIPFEEDGILGQLYAGYKPSKWTY